MESFYERIKVLTEKGMNLATVRFRYRTGEMKIEKIEGRTIHPDGTVVVMTASPAELLDFQTKGLRENEIAFTLPSVEVGSILEYRVQLRYPSGILEPPVWDVQRQYFVRKAHYRFRSEGGLAWNLNDAQGQELRYLLYSGHLGFAPDAKVVSDAKHDFTLDVANVPPLPQEEWMPPLDLVRGRVTFYYSHFSTVTDFWTNALDQWSGNALQFMQPGDSIKKAASQLVDPSDSETTKTEKLYAAVMKMENTSFGRAKSEAERKALKIGAVRKADDVWQQQSGTSNEIALTFVALARTAGLNAWPMQVVDRNRGELDHAYLSLRQLDDYIAVVTIGGSDFFLDPGEKMCPFGMLHWKHAETKGLVLSNKGAFIGTTPAIHYKNAMVLRVANLNVQPDGSLDGTARIEMRGPEALRWRQLALTADPMEAAKRFVEELSQRLPEGARAEFDHFEALDDPKATLVAFVRLNGSIGAQTKNRLVVPDLLFEAHAQHAFVSQEHRQTDVDLQFAHLDEDDITYHLPAGSKVEGAPQQTSISWPGHSLFKMEAKERPGEIEIQRSLAYGFSRAEAKDYGELHDFSQKVETADQQVMLIEKSSSAQQ